MKITILITALTFGALLGSGSIGAAAEEGWTVMADMPTAKFGMSVVELDGKLFAIGGSQANAISATVEEYDPASDSWKSLADMPTARKDTAAAVVDGTIYVFGGAQVLVGGAIKTTEAYDPATDTWTTKRDMPTARRGLSAVPVDGKIYVIGGWGVSTFESVVEVYDPATDTWEAKTNTPAADGNFGFAGVNGKVYLFCGTRNRTITREYDPVTDTWTTKAAIPSGRHYPSATVLDGKVYVLGGIVSLEDSPTDRMDIYDPVADTWTEGLKMPTARGNLSAVTLNGQIHAIGGQTGVTWGNPGTVYATIEVYNSASEPPAEEGWTVMADMPTAKFGMSVVELDGKLFAIGGSQANAISATVEEYDPASDSWKSVADMPTARKDTAAAVVDGKIYVFGGAQVLVGGAIKTTEAYDPATDTWTTKRDMPTARRGLSAVPVDGKIYVIGGWGVSTFESVVEVYDPATDTWEAKTNTPAADGNFGFAGVNGKVYLFCGTRNRTITREYDPVTDTWTTKAAIPSGRHYPSATVLDGKVYVLGGIVSLEDSPTDRMDIYDPVGDTWTEGLKMPTARGNLSAVTLNGQIHAIGGQTGVTWGNPGTVYATIEVYSPASEPPAEERWTVMADMPTAKFGMSVVELDGKLFAIGGSQANARSATVEEYDPASDSWKSLADMPTARKETAAAVVDGKIYVFGGTQVLLNGSLRTTESYDPATDTWTTKKDMPTARQGLAAVPVDGKIYVIGGWGSTWESVVEVYDPATDTWEAKTNTPAADGNLGFAGVNGKVYLFGGQRNRTITREYDPVTDSWTTKAAIPNGRPYTSATVLDGKVYVLGGGGWVISATDRMDIYDPVADTWTEGLKMPTARGNLSAVTLNGRIHAIGGLTGIGWGDPGTVYATVEVYSPAPLEGDDSDADGMADRWESVYFGDLSHDGTEDTDGDGLDDLGEYENRANPTVEDTDGDGLSDGDEVAIYGSNPAEVDTDGDTLSDGDEVNIHNTNPVERDTDGDNFDDNVELALGTDTNDAADFPDQITAVQSGPWDSAATWSNNQAPTAGSDYVLVGSVAAQLQTTAITFPGDSLTLTGPGATLFSNHSGDASVADLIVENGAIEAGRDGSLGGRITMSGDNVIDPRTATFTINAAISGDGTLAIQSGDPGDATGNVILLGADGAYAGSTTVTGTTLTIGGAFAFAGDITLEGANLIVDAGQLIPQANLIIQGDGSSITLNNNLQVGDVIGLDANGAQVFSLRDLLELEPNERAELTAADLGDVFQNAEIVMGDGLLILDSTVVDDSVPPVWADYFDVDLDTIDLDADHDGDGLSTRAEAVFGTDPFDPESAVRLRITTAPDLRVTWDTVPGARYQPEVGSDLLAWSPAGPAIDGDGGPVSIDIVPEFFGAFLRVRGLPPRDSDGDGLDDLEEAMLGTDPFRIDTDGDGDSDFREVFELGTDPLTANSSAFVLIPGGSFQMGDTFGEGESDELPVHMVNVPAFFMQARETTKAEWDDVRAWALENGYAFDQAGEGRAADHPVHSVNWWDVVKWCNARSEMEGLTPCYYLEDAHTSVYRTGTNNLTNTMVDWGANGYRLPTEAEWEKAARGGLQGRRFPWGDTITHALANYQSASRYAYDTSPTRGHHPDWDDGTEPYTSPVGSFPPNGYGLFDMTGNVWEFCWDRYGNDYYADSPVAAPVGPDSGSGRVIRGGSWRDRVFAFYGRVAGRYGVLPSGGDLPSDGFSRLGFRPARGQ